MLKLVVVVKFKEGIDDPEGKSITHSLNLLGFENVKRVNVAKQYEIFVDADISKGREIGEKIVKKLLVNPVIHDYELRVEEI